MTGLPVGIPVAPMRIDAHSSVVALGSCRPKEMTMALDWWNGNRSLLEDDQLSGLILGLNLRTKPEEILRALFEALGFAAKMIIEEHRKYQVPVERIFAVGGIAEKNPHFVQILTDITECEIHVPGVSQACALGSAIYATVAAGKSRGGYDTLEEAVEHMACKEAF